MRHTEWSRYEHRVHDLPGFQASGASRPFQPREYESKFTTFQLSRTKEGVGSASRTGRTPCIARSDTGHLLQNLHKPHPAPIRQVDPPISPSRRQNLDATVDCRLAQSGDAPSLVGRSRRGGTIIQCEMENECEVVLSAGRADCDKPIYCRDLHDAL